MHHVRSAVTPSCIKPQGPHACRAHILSKKVSPRAFVDQPHKKGQAAGEVGIEGTAIEAPVEVRFAEQQVACDAISVK